MDWTKPTYEFPERLWKRSIEFHNGKPRIRAAASSYTPPTSFPSLRDEKDTMDPQQDQRSELGEEPADQLDKSPEIEPQVKVSTEGGNTKITVELAAIRKEDLKVNCAEDSVTLSVRIPSGSWVKEIRLPFHVDPDTAKAVFRNGTLELVVRKHGRFNPPGPRIDWV